MSIRGSIARRSVGGPRFRLQPDRILVEVEGDSNLSSLVDGIESEVDGLLDEAPVPEGDLSRVVGELNRLGFDTRELRNLGVIAAETDNLERVMSNITEARNQFDPNVARQVDKALQRAKNKGAATILGNFSPGNMNFGQREKAELEAAIRSELSNINLKNSVTKAIQEIDGVVNAEIRYTRNTFGPRNLNLDVVSDVRDVTRDITEEEPAKPDVGDALDKMGVPTAWETDTGENAVAAIFDTSFCQDFFQSDKVIGTFSGPDVDSAYSAPEEGHGTMTAYSMAGNDSGHSLTYHGVAKDADVLLARVSDSDGGLSYVAEAWDWLIGRIKQLDRPVISNHSYGVPLCSARTMQNCDTTTTKVARVANQRTDHQAFYAAGNEAIYCGHRLGGMTNGINGINSDPTSITGAAFRYDLMDAQNYSSHGFGTCTSVGENPKPDLGCLLPDIVPYGCKEKDMSTGQGGSGGGTSEATPLCAGVATLVASITGSAERSVIEGVLEDTAQQVRRTQINIVRKHDARFGNGQVRADAAVEKATQLSE